VKKFLIDPISPPIPPLPLNAYHIMAIKLPNTASTPIKYPMGLASEDSVLPMAFTAHPNTLTMDVNRFCSPFTRDWIAPLIADVWLTSYTGILCCI